MFLYANLTGNIGTATISTANPYLNGSGSIVSVYTANSDANGANGATIKSITIKALQSTSEGMIRLFINSGAGWSLMQEVLVPQTTPSGVVPSFTSVLKKNFKLEPGYSIGASTQNAENFVITIDVVEWAYPPTVTIYSRTLAIDYTKCGSSNSSNFTVLVSAQDNTLKTVANGGHVANSDGYDIMFFSDPTELSLLFWEVEYYDPVNGILLAWVKIPTVSNTANVPFYMQYGNTSIATFQGGGTGTAWDSNYKGVWHLHGGGSYPDSTTNGNNGNVTGSVLSVAGQIDGGAGFPASGANYILLNSAPLSGTGNFTISCWANFSDSGIRRSLISLRNTSGATNTCAFLYRNATDQLEFDLANVPGPSSTSTLSTGVWYHCTVVYNGSLIQLYLNGATTGSAAPMSPALLTTQSLFGVYNTPSTYPMDGSMDEIRISNSARSANWILTEYNNQNNPGNISTPGFIIYGGETIV